MDSMVQNFMEKTIENPSCFDEFISLLINPKTETDNFSDVIIFSDGESPNVEVIIRDGNNHQANISFKQEDVLDSDYLQEYLIEAEEMFTEDMETNRQILKQKLAELYSKAYKDVRMEKFERDCFPPTIF